MPFDLLPRAMPPSEIMADGDGERLDVFVARRLPPLSRTAARRLINEGLVLVEGGLERPSYRLRAGEMVRVQAEPATAVMVAEPIDIPLDVRYEDADLIGAQQARRPHGAPRPRRARSDARQRPAGALPRPAADRRRAAPGPGAPPR